MDEQKPQKEKPQEEKQDPAGVELPQTEEPAVTPQVTEEPVVTPQVSAAQKLKKRDQFFKNPTFWVIVLLILTISAGTWIRVQPMTDHNGNPGLWDVTTNTWTLGPDLDPWLFFRAAKQILEEGRIPEIDTFRSVPRGAFTRWETKLLPYMIVWTYYGVNLFGDYNLEYAAVIFPVIAFILTTLAFFLFTREIFVGSTKKSKLKANIIALIASFLMATVPSFLTRTIAGIPEKESTAFLFVFLALYLYIKAWKSTGIKENERRSGSNRVKPILLSLLAGISTGLLSLIWGGYLYIFLPIGIATFAAFILNKINLKSFGVYSVWLISSFLIMLLNSSRYTAEGMLTSLSMGPAVLVFFILVIHMILWGPLKKYLEKVSNKYPKLSKTIISLIIAMILLIILISIFLGPVFIIDKAKSIHQAIFKPVYGRWNTTVAENKQPFFTDWREHLGPIVGGFPLLFWMSFAGAMILFKGMLKPLKKKDALKLTGYFIFFLLGLIFSRFASNSIFNGANFISKAFYYTSTFLFICMIIGYYLKYHKEKNKAFEEINYTSLLILSLYIICLFTSRGAIRLLIVLAAISPIFVGYLCVKIFEIWNEADDDTSKVIYGAIMITVFCLTFTTGLTYYRSSEARAYNYVPGGYNVQWQKAMDWVRTDTPENSVFISWWDYGYWIQSIGERATVLDGGNGITWWNYLCGRLVLTGTNEFDLREFSYNHEVTHLLIDSTDVGKYGAFSSIGSDENYDRLSYFGTFIQDQRQTQEMQNETQFIYTGGIGLDEDIIIENGNVLLPAGGAGIGMMLLPWDNLEKTYNQPIVMMSYQGKHTQVAMRYLYIAKDDRFIDFDSGIEAAMYVYPQLAQTNAGINENPVGAAMYISPRLLRGMFSQVYLLKDPFDNYPNVKLVHTEPDLIIAQLEAQGMDLPDWSYFQGNRGPIKIYEVNYLGNEKYKEEYHAIDYSPYIDWRL